MAAAEGHGLSAVRQGCGGVYGTSTHRTGPRAKEGGMMRVTIAGGVGEHGRNGFLVESRELSFLVDCGVMAGAAMPDR